MQAEISNALLQIESVKKGIDECDDPKLQMQTAESLQTILEILNDPVFRQIIQCQDSLTDLNSQIAQHPSILPSDFDIDLSGNLVLGPTHIYDDEQKVPSKNPSRVHSPINDFMDSLGE